MSRKSKIFGVKLSILFAFCITDLQCQISNLLVSSYDNIVRLNFTGSGAPTVNYTGISNGFEAIAHAEDGLGNILFFVNSNGVYNYSTGLLMNGSAGLLANPSSAEIVICPNPSNSNQYYIFYNSETCSYLYYSLVDMSLNAGQGGVIQLNTVLESQNFAEGLEIVQVPCQQMYWLVVYQCGVGLKRFKIDASGISTSQLVYNHTAPSSMYDGRGELDYHLGKLGISFSYSNDALIGDFDPITGNFTNAVNLDLNAYTTLGGLYGIEFSPDASKVYMTAWYESTNNNLFQYDFATGAVQSWLLTSNQGNSSSLTGPGEIELGPDGNLYCVYDGGTQIQVISNANLLQPNFSKITANFTGALGVSDHIQSNVYGSSNGFTYINNCLGDSTNFFGVFASCSVTSVSWSWDFGDPTSGSNNFSTVQSPAHYYASPGIYDVSLILTSGTGSSDTIQHSITISTPLLFNIGNDTTICNGSSVSYTGPLIAGAEYFWSNGDTTVTTEASVAGELVFVVNQGGCISSDTVYVNLLSNGVPDLGPDMTLCPGEVLSLYDNSFSTNTTWSTGQTNINSIQVTNPGIYWLEISELGCTIRDSLEVFSSDIYQNIFGNDTTICNGEFLVYDVSPGNGFCVWDGLFFGPQYSISTSGEHTLALYIGTCVFYDTINVNVESSSNLNLGPDIKKCEGATAVLNSNVSAGNLVWSTGATTSTITVNQTGYYFLSVSGNCGNSSDTIHVVFNEYPVSLLEKEFTSCIPFVLELKAGNQNYQYNWSTGANTPVINVDEAGIYSVIINNQSCVTKDTCKVIGTLFNEDQELPNIITPNGDGKNDFLSYQNLIECDNFFIEIYDRWGMKVIESNDPINTWNGSGKSAGVYYYIVNYSNPCNNNSLTKRQGYIHLIK